MSTYILPYRDASKIFPEIYPGSHGVIPGGRSHRQLLETVEATLSSLGKRRTNMAKIEDLIGQVPDQRLKKSITAEVIELKRNKKFGLVFEEHLPETVRLPNLPVKEGEIVAKKRESGNVLWRVKSIATGSPDWTSRVMHCRRK